VRADSPATSATRLVISGLSLGAAGSDVLPRSSGVNPREVDVSVDTADHCAQDDQDE